MKITVTSLTQRECEYKKPRIFVSIKGDAFDALHTRIGVSDETPEEKTETRRCYNAQRKVMRDAIKLAFERMGFSSDLSEAAAKSSKWSWKAGCSMCPCSPGFVYEGSLLGKRSLWVRAEVA